MKILVTGFDPFGGEKVNPAIEAVKRLEDEIKGAEIIKLEIPTSISRCDEILKENIDRHRPDVVVSVGQAGGRAGITVERVAINIDDFGIDDNDGNSPIDEKICEGPDAYLLTLPIKAMVSKIREAGIPASVSNTAGTFVCNHVAYFVANLAGRDYPHMKTGFVHIPYLPEQVSTKEEVASMSIENIVKALSLGIEAIVENREDLKITGGKTH